MNIILFDGTCLFCQRSVQFILKRDPEGYFKFGSLQSEKGQKLLHQYNVKRDLDSVVLIKNDQVFMKSSAALEIGKHLKGGYRILSVLKVIPAPIRDAVYDWFAKHRYQWFGKSESCMMPSPEFKKRFID
ncbi:putative DCC family thiol-disulfide oxidoreductase YuxK [Bacillus ectoiniformans]|uniref:thiol-disulfide oxidoreductase DCC family protein n=1 Tax=Bacillus ectoiniformans TaxID=1494429 RepID=UPI00195BE196|nr:thiol-disulfide oxidoreductase DCC family protein [Bacillus ectoiniformans]MBM7647729.1 putative DCC family thiol-disulfide oxidoreductase YuxK [Bacillus ectoiniformans]